ncbi:MAG: hypothetical protein ACNA7T_10310 [Haliea sp.]|nr:hypothetical protein [Roseovarius sp.]
MPLDETDIDKIAERLVKKVRADKHEFWVDPESHYHDHKRFRKLDDDDIHTLRDLVMAYRNARGLFWRSFLGFAIIGSLVLGALGMGFRIGGH